MEKEGVYKVEKTSESKEREPDIRVPIIDVIRHGKTDYKELQDIGFEFDPDSEDFKLDTEHLDLNEKGIKEIIETAEQLEGVIDKDNEVVILVTSPNYRAQSSTLLIEDYLKQKGVNILNPAKKILKAQNLRQITFKDAESRPEWIKTDKEFREKHPDHKLLASDKAHAEIAKMLGKDITDIFSEDYDKINQRFQRFLRHMTNLNYWLQDETKESLKDKRIRLVCLTHEELPARFMKQALDTKESLRKGQILEIQPNKFLKAGEKTDAKVILYPKGKSERKEGNISIEFNPDKATE